MLGGAVFVSLGSIGFAFLQLAGSRWVSQWQDRVLFAKFGHAQDFHRAIHTIYRRHGGVALSIALQLAGWITSGLWLWVILRVMGIAPNVWTAIAIQALVEGLRSATVFIPASVGVQEAGYTILAPVFGLSPEVGLSLSLLRRARDLVVAVPVLLTWELIEGHALRRSSYLTTAIAREVEVGAASSTREPKS